jgi:hypothetical protein
MYKDSWALKGTFTLGPFNELKVLGPLLLGVLTEEMPLTRSCGFNFKLY